MRTGQIRTGPFRTGLLRTGLVRTSQVGIVQVIQLFSPLVARTGTNNRVREIEVKGW